MKLLQEMINPNSVSLTNTQQGVLLVIKTAPTPEVAYENTNGENKLVYARNMLRVLGLIKVANNQCVLTPNGEKSILNYNLVNASGEMTSTGSNLMNSFISEFKKESDTDSSVSITDTKIN